MKPLMYSVEGAYDRAIEESANRLFLYSQSSSQDAQKTEASGNDGSASSGYSSDVETSQMQTDLEVSSVSSKTSSSFSGSSFSSATPPSVISDRSSPSEGSSTKLPSDDSLESEIRFLQEKQTLMKRAIDAMKREEAYEATRAYRTLKGQFEREISPLWAEAKDVMEVLVERENGENEARNDSIDTFEDTREKSLQESPLKKTKIDVSNVNFATSSSFINNDKEEPVSHRATPSPIHVRTIFELEGPWVSHVISRTLTASIDNEDDATSSSEKPGTKDWQVLNDPDLGLLVVPPSLLSLRNGIELSDALALTSQAQLVTMSTPPFCVVHANKAFCQYSGLESADIIGKPVESLLQAKQHPVGDELKISESGSLACSLAISSKPCALALTPVTDKFRNPTGGMSHLLVKIDSLSEDATLATVESASSCTVEEPSVKKDITTNTTTSQPHHQVIGTIG